jgi:hypothetical protein
MRLRSPLIDGLALLAALTLIFGIIRNSAIAVPPTRLLVDLSLKPAPQGLSAFDLCVLRVDAQVDLEAAHALGNVCLARVPLFEVTAESGAADLARQLGVPLLAGQGKGKLHLDATHPGWPQVVVHELVETAAERGFDGVVFCQLEQISQDAVRAAVLETLALVKRAYPDKRLFIEGGFDLVSEARLSLDGILFVDEKGRDEGDELRLGKRLRECRRLGVQPYVVAFADPEQPGEVPVRAAWIREQGGVPFFTTPELEGVNLGPLEEVERRVLVLHTGEARESYTARVLHGSLEWLGWQVRYQQAAAVQGAEAWPGQHGSIQAVILDQTLNVGQEQQHSLAEMVVGLVRQQVPVLLTGLPWEREADWAAVCAALGIRGGGRPVELRTPASLRVAEGGLLARQGSSTPRTTGLREVRCAAADAQVLLSVVAGEGDAYDQVWLASWGGMWLDPLAVELGPQLNPLLFLEKWLKRQPVLPVMDTASLDGRRLLVTQVQAEGFAAITEQPGLPLAGEVMLEKVLARYALPFSVALNEADLRGWSPGADARQAARLHEAARGIFELGHVEPVSAGLARPTGWQGSEPMAAILGADAPTLRIDLVREVAGSLAYLHRQCLPAGRSMAAFAWPEGCLPGTEAANFSRQVGVENLLTWPRGATLSLGLPALAPQSWNLGNSVCAILPPPPRQGTLRHAGAEIASLQQGSLNGRWLSPALISLSFHDVVRSQDLEQVGRLLDWCASQPFHAITAGQYARLVRDARQTRIYQTGSARWIIVNEGQARTLRLPASAGVPDLERSTGVVGYSRQGDQIYIHTLGLRRTELVLRAEPQRGYLRLASASGDMRYLVAGGSRAIFQVSHPRPVELAFEGIPPGTVCQILANGAPEYPIADTSGRVEFTVPSQATVQVRLLPGQTAAMR